jgi:hypothetical protein
MRSVANKPIMLNVVLLNVVILNVVMLNVAVLILLASDGSTLAERKVKDSIAVTLWHSKFEFFKPIYPSQMG